MSLHLQYLLLMIQLTYFYIFFNIVKIYKNIIFLSNYVKFENSQFKEEYFFKF